MGTDHLSVCELFRLLSEEIVQILKEDIWALLGTVKAVIQLPRALPLTRGFPARCVCAGCA